MCKSYMYDLGMWILPSPVVRSVGIPSVSAQRQGHGDVNGQRRRRLGSRLVSSSQRRPPWSVQRSTEGWRGVSSCNDYRFTERVFDHRRYIRLHHGKFSLSGRHHLNWCQDRSIHLSDIFCCINVFLKAVPKFNQVNHLGYLTRFGTSQTTALEATPWLNLVYHQPPYNTCARTVHSRFVAATRWYWSFKNGSRKGSELTQNRRPLPPTPERLSNGPRSSTHSVRT